jgi:phosphate transport system protein
MTLLLHKEIERLKKELLALGAIVEELLRKSVRSLQGRDAALAREVIEADERVDNREVELEEDGLKIIALHQPVAIDLRFIVSVLRINSDLERIGDLAVNIAERASYLAGAELPAAVIDFAPMAEKAQEMLTKSLDAFVNMDTGLAQRILEMDNEVDAMNRKMFCTIYEFIRKNPEDVEALLHLLSASRHLERIADHATNIAEDVIYMVEGNIVRHKPEDYPGAESCGGEGG